MPKPAPADRPRARSGQGGAAPVLVDDLVAERNSPPLPPEPVFTIDLVEAEAGRRGRRYVAELEELARRNALAATEARDIALEQRRHLEATARGRRNAEREISRLRRELSVAVAEQQRLAALTTTPRPAAPPGDGHETARLRESIEEQQRLIGEHRDRLAAALRERDEARLEARRAATARERAERSVAATSEMLRRQATEPAVAPDGPGVDPALGERLEARVAELEIALGDADAGRDAAAARIAELERALGAAEASRDAAAARVAALERALGDAEASRDAAAARVAALEDAVVAADSERDAGQGRARELEATVTRIEAELDTARAQGDELAQALAEARAAAADLEASMASVGSERDAARARVDELEAALAATGATKVELDATVDVATRERDVALARVEELERAVDAAVDEARVAREQAEAGREELAGAESRVVAWTTAAADARLALEMSEQARADERAQAQVQVDRLAHRLAELEEMVVAREAPAPAEPALEELAGLAAPEPGPAPPERPEREEEPAVGPAATPAPAVAEVADRAELRRTLLAGLSDLAADGGDGNAPP